MDPPQDLEAAAPRDADQRVADAQRHGIEHARDRDPQRLIPDPAEILHRRVQTGLQHLEARDPKLIPGPALARSTDDGAEPRPKMSAKPMILNRQLSNERAGRLGRDLPRRQTWWLPPVASPTAHSITSSARARSDCGTVRPSALAVFRLIDQLEFGRLLDRQIGRLGALEDLSGVNAEPGDRQP